MTKRVVIAHGWADNPTKGWIAWLASELSKSGIKAAAPQFPNAKTPDPKAWIQTLSDSIGQPDEGLVLVGHSLGCLVALKYLSDLATSPSTGSGNKLETGPGNILAERSRSPRIAGIVLVAGLPTTDNWRPEGLYPIDFASIKQIAAKRICIYSNDDDKVLPERTKELATLIDAELILDPSKGHFAGLHGCTELPSALNAVLSCYTRS